MRLSTLDAKLTVQRIRLVCPKCGEHSIVVPFGSGWSVIAGTTIEDVTVAPSVWLQTECKAHFNIIAGDVVFA